jgi:hypothetical protein
VTGDLMPRGIHTFDQCWLWNGSVVNLALAVVDPGDEECCFRIIGVENIEDVRRVDPWSVIEGERDSASNKAVIDAISTMGDAANLGRAMPRVDAPGGVLSPSQPEP